MKRLLGNIRTLLVLGRVSNLPTVWSNILAGWLITSPFDLAPLVLLLIGASCLYIGGMYLNDFCDTKFDAEYCKNRPIPAGKIQRPLVGTLAVIWFLFGLGCLIVFNPLTLGLAAALVVTIILYDLHHKGVTWAPLLMGFCRFLLYPLAASAAAPRERFSEVLAAGTALGLYIAGITYLARGESRPENPARWALALLAVPIILSIALHGPFNAIYPCAALVFWTAWILIPLWRGKSTIGNAVSGLLAGIVLVDIVAASGVSTHNALYFPPLFIFALLLQRFVPAT